jgi:hypothetical protein
MDRLIIFILNLGVHEVPEEPYTPDLLRCDLTRLSAGCYKLVGTESERRSLHED